jgi:outer membrane protein assembly factor BamB/protocatechuate 3,4-dioxygenase beta subunit
MRSQQFGEEFSMNSQKLSSVQPLPKCYLQAVILCLATIFTGCAGPSDPESSPQSASVNLTFPYLAKEVKTLEYRLEPNGNTTVKGTDLTRVGQITVDPTTSPKLELTDLSTGSYQITVKAKDATDGIVLYKTTRAVQAQPAPKANSSNKQTAPQTIVLGRATGVVELSTTAPTDGTTLNYIAQLGANKINLRLENNQLLGRFNAVPTGRNLELLVEGRDRAGTLLYQGGKRFDLPDALVSQNLELTQVTAERVPPVISSIRVPNQVAPGEKFKLELELKASQNPSTATLSDVLVNWGDGISEIPTVSGATATLTLEHAFTEVNAQVITITAINNFGLRAQETRDVNVTDSNPNTTRPESPLSLVHFVVRDVPWNVDSLEAKISPIAATAGARPTEPERTIRLTKQTATTWDGTVQLLKRTKYATNLTARVVALSQALQSTNNGTYTPVVPQLDSETVELRFGVPNVANPGDDLTLQVTPSSMLVSGINQTRNLTVRAYNAAGDEVSTDNLGIEWISSDSIHFPLIASSTSTKLATLTTRTDAGFAVLMARSRVNSKLTSNPVSVMNAEVKRSVRLIDDADVIFPPPDVASWELPNETHFSDSPNPIDFGGFTLAEIFDVYKAIGQPGVATNDFYLRKPLLLRGAAPLVGTVLAASGGSDVFDKVIAVETRGNLSLLQLQPVEPYDVYGRIKFNFDYQRLVGSGLIPDDSSGAVLSALLGRAGKSAPADKKCEFDPNAEGSERGFEISKPELDKDLFVKDQLMFQTDLDFGDVAADPPRPPKMNSFQLQFGVDAKLDYKPKVKLTATQKATLSCKLYESTLFEKQIVSPKSLNENQTRKPTPRFIQAAIRLVLSLIVVRAKYDLSIEAEATLEGETEFDVGLRFQATASPRFAINYNGSGKPEIITPKQDDFDFKFTNEFNSKKILETALSELQVQADVKFALVNKVTGNIGVIKLDKEYDQVTNAFKDVDRFLKDVQKLKDFISRTQIFSNVISKAISKLGLEPVVEKLLTDLGVAAFKKLTVVLIQQIEAQAAAVSAVVGLLNGGLDIITFTASPEIQLTWANTRKVLGEKKTPSIITSDLLVEAKWTLENINKLFAAFKVDTLPDDKSTIFEKKFLRFTEYRPLAEDKIIVNGRDTSETGPIGVADGETAKLVVNTKFLEESGLDGKDENGKEKPLVKLVMLPGIPDSPPAKGLLYLDGKTGFKLIKDKDKNVELTASGNTLTGDLQITEDLCKLLEIEGKLEKRAGTFYVIGYNKMSGILETAGYVGAFSLRCGDEVYFTADEQPFPSPNGKDIAIVGNVSAVDCYDKARDVRLKAYLTTKPRSEWKVKDVKFYLDGELLKEGSGDSPFVLPIPPEGPVLRDLAAEVHGFKITYTAVKGDQTREEEFNQPFTVKLKPKDPNLDCSGGGGGNPDSPNASRYPSRQPPEGGPTPGGGGSRNFPVVGNTGLNGVTPFTLGGGGGSGGGSDPTGTSNGDPHISTIDGITYTTMTLGEFVYARSNAAPGGVELQSRHGRISNFADWASFNVAAAVKAGGNTFEVRLPPNRAATEKLILLLNGKPLELPTGVYTFGEATIQIEADNSLVVYSLEKDLPATVANTPKAWTRVRIGKKPDNDLVRPDTTEPIVSLDISMNTAPIGRYQGLLGTPNGQRSDEMTIPNGSVVTSLKGFVEAWRNTDRTKSLFTYETGQGPETFNVVQDKVRPTKADLIGTNGGRNYIAEITALIRDNCLENPASVDPAFIEQQALELAVGRTTQNMIANGFCFDGRVYKAGLPLPSFTTAQFTGQVLLEGLTAGASGATVVVTSPTIGLKLCETTTDNEGRYRCGYNFERPANSSTLQLIYRVRGRGTTLERDVNVAMPDANTIGLVEQNFTAKVRNTLHLRGRVLDPAGAVVPNAFLRIVSPYREFVADANGVYDVYEPVPDGITSGSVRLEATDPNVSGFVGRDLSYPAIQPGIIDLTQDLQLQANKPPVTPIDTSKIKYLTVLGRVVNSLDPDKKGVSGMTVSINAYGNIKGDFCKTATDSLGNYACALELTTDNPFTAQVQVYGGRTSSLSTPLNIVADDFPAPGGTSNKTVADIQLQAIRYLKVLGRVLDAFDPTKGVVNATVTIRAPGSIKGDVCTTSTNALGNYQCESELITFQPFSAVVEISGTGSAAPVTVNVGTNELPTAGFSRDKTVADIQGQATILQVTGIVRGQGNVIAEANVLVTFGGYSTAYSTVTDASGRYTLRFPIKNDYVSSDGKYGVSARYVTPAGTSETSADLNIGTITPGVVNERTQDLEFVTRNLVFTGLVRNAFAGGQPVGEAFVDNRFFNGANVKILRNGQDICTSRTSTTSPNIGRYTCNYSVTSPDPFQVTYQVSERGSLLLENVTVDPSIAPVNGQTPIVRDLEVRPSTIRLSGAVTKTGGAVVPNARIEVLGDLQTTFQADAQGRYSVFYDFPDRVTTTNFELRALDGSSIITRTLTVPLTLNTLIERVENFEIVTSNSGTLKWTYTDSNPSGGLDSSRTSVVGSDGTVYTIRYDTVTNRYLLFAVAPDGTQRWTYNEPTEDFYSTRLRVGSDGTIYVASGNSSAINLYAINPNGTRKYLFQTADPIKSDPLPGANGVVYMIFGSKLYKIGANGSSIWSATINSGDLASSGNYSATGGIKELADGSVVVVTTKGYNFSGKGSLVVINADGSVRRSTELETGFNRVERVEADGTMYAYRSYLYEGPDSEFAVFNPDGTVRWSRSGSGGDSSYAIAANGTTYLKINSDLIALDPAGNQLWINPIGIYQMALLSDGTIIATAGSEVKAIAIDGTLKWTYTLSASSDSLKIGNDSTIYVGTSTAGFPSSTRDRIVALNPDGSSKWQFTDPDASSLSAILEFGNVIYFNSNKKLFAINR